jgi:two-component system, OmpR family, sensor histidine kinase MprB
MSFRRRMVVLSAGAVAAAVVIASVVVYVVTRNDLIGQVDRSLRQIPQTVQFQSQHGTRLIAGLGKEGKLPPGAAAQIGVTLGSAGQLVGGGAKLTAPAPVAHGGQGQTTVVQRSDRSVTKPDRATPAPGAPGKLLLPAQKLGGATGYVQLYQTNGRLVHTESRGLLLPITVATREAAAGRRGAFYSNITVAGTPVRMLTEQAAPGGVWQAALPLTDVNNTLSQLLLVLVLVSLGGIALAAMLGLLVSRAALVPVRRLTGAAERVAATQDLGHRIETGEHDELGRLAGSFNTMLAALERSRLAQRQLVSDASHELRTPLTSIRANLDVLSAGASLPERDRARVIDAARAQLSELTVLVGDLVDLSKTGIDAVEIEDVRLDLATAGAIERARVHAPECRFVLDAQPCLVRAAPGRLDRAIANLLDNAAKWGPAGGPVEVRVRDGCVRVTDHGPGFAEEDLPHVFDRFYRAPAARALPGSGLGLAIVRQVAETHGGSVNAANDPGSGAILELRLAALELTAADHAVPSAVQEAPPIL